MSGWLLQAGLGLATSGVWLVSGLGLAVMCHGEPLCAVGPESIFQSLVRIIPPYGAIPQAGNEEIDQLAKAAVTTDPRQVSWCLQREQTLLCCDGTTLSFCKLLGSKVADVPMDINIPAQKVSLILMYLVKHNGIRLILLHCVLLP